MIALEKPRVGVSRQKELKGIDTHMTEEEKVPARLNTRVQVISGSYSGLTGTIDRIAENVVIANGYLIRFDVRPGDKTSPGLTWLKLAVLRTIDGRELQQV